MDRLAQPLAGQPVIIGAGLAELMTVLHVSPEPVIVLAKAPLASASASAWAQDGIAAAFSRDDSATLHASDTITSGDGLCNPHAVERIICVARSAVEDLVRHGVVFDRNADGEFKLGLEAAHSRRRIVHALGDGTGREILRALTEAVRQTPSITVLEDLEARRLFVEGGKLVGVLALARRGPLLLPSSRVIIATGGMGGLYCAATNPLGSIGEGLALAARVGAALIDMEFVQFHPTALDVGIDPMPLVSEAVRGEGAVLIDDTGERFMAREARAELQPRNIVPRAVWRHLSQGHHVFLDARAALGADFAARFPGITAACRTADIDPSTTPIPVRPGATIIWAESPWTIRGAPPSMDCGPAARWPPQVCTVPIALPETRCWKQPCARWVAKSVSGTTAQPEGKLPPVAVPQTADAGPVRAIMARHVGVLRGAIEALRSIAFSTGGATDAATDELMIATAALLREESRGGHFRTDFPHPSNRVCRLSLHLGAGDVVARSIPVASTTVSVGG